jgi:hypothetical protein
MTPLKEKQGGKKYSPIFVQERAALREKPAE